MDDAITELLDQVSTADELLLDLVRHAHLDCDIRTRHQARTRLLAHTGAPDAVAAVRALAAGWRHLDVFDLALRAACDTALAAACQVRCPSDAAVLSAPWKLGLTVRAQLRAGGPGLEAVASRLLATWSLPLTDLPRAAAVIAAPSSR